MRKFLTTLREWASDYEPAVARALVAALLQIFVVAGVALGNLPEIADAALTFVALVTTLLAGGSIRKHVYSKATFDNEVAATHQRSYSQGAFDQQAISRGGR